MHEFKVWAPRANKIAIKIGNEATAMQGPSESGWWKASIDSADDGTDYAFLLDDDNTLYPDPRSLWQPEGVHGRSRVYDQRRFHWTDDTWQGPPFSGAILYELHIGTFTAEGTFDSAIARLDHLHALGVTHIEIMPVNAFPGAQGWGYDGVALYAVQQSYGGPDALKRFVDACHHRGLAVILDVVYNHFGPTGNYTGKFGPYLTDRHKTPWGDAVNFDEGGSDEVRRFFCDNALMWMRDYHIDGLRLDAIHEFMDRSAVHFLEQLSSEVETLSATLQRKLILIAESDLNDPKIVRPREAGGYGIDAQWSDDFHHALFTLMHMEPNGAGYYSDFGSFEKLVKALTHIFVFDGGYSRYRNRSHGRPVDGLSAHHFISFIQNHDQIGNRAKGERLEHLVGMNRARIAAALLFTAPFIPMIFQGEEFAASTPFLYFADHEDEEMARLVSAGRRREFAAFGFDGDDIADPENEATFLRSKLHWSELNEGIHAEMHIWFRSLIRLRRCSQSLNDGDKDHVEIRYDEEKKWLCMQRGLVTILCNLGETSPQFEAPEDSRLELSTVPSLAIVDGKVTLPPDSLCILSAEEPY
ncbi:maltooligosyl trehalose hydrolase [Granulicella pectinivorans]|uniref:Malto-oligosyltrehalose trehalohydrolase n=1 Tax=Granulicella pectinivorans TaxID=474950 RepID=A0A1I6MZ64_9BACT|nr:malto-oligosyltrehalose trehalohydrolase [Granulicella pectinivorans]SFS20990.1 maltooligosyl trehalose hydrolase [Granulicella pectinivorans]